jgi:hypothetical protein
MRLENWKLYLPVQVWGVPASQTKCEYEDLSANRLISMLWLVLGASGPRGFGRRAGCCLGRICRLRRASGALAERVLMDSLVRSNKASPDCLRETKETSGKKKGAQKSAFLSVWMSSFSSDSGRACKDPRPLRRCNQPVPSTESRGSRPTAADAVVRPFHRDV